VTFIDLAYLQSETVNALTFLSETCDDRKSYNRSLREKIHFGAKASRTITILWRHRTLLASEIVIVGADQGTPIGNLGR
jgi:hypothetical protein